MTSVADLLLQAAHLPEPVAADLAANPAMARAMAANPHLPDSLVAVAAAHADASVLPQMLALPATPARVRAGLYRLAELMTGDAIDQALTAAVDEALGRGLTAPGADPAAVHELTGPLGPHTARAIMVITQNIDLLAATDRNTRLAWLSSPYCPVDDPQVMTLLVASELDSRLNPTVAVPLMAAVLLRHPGTRSRLTQRGSLDDVSRVIVDRAEGVLNTAQRHAEAAKTGPLHGLGTLKKVLGVPPGQAPLVLETPLAPWIRALIALRPGLTAAQRALVASHLNVPGPEDTLGFLAPVVGERVGRVLDVGAVAADLLSLPPAPPAVTRPPLRPASGNSTTPVRRLAAADAPYAAGVLRDRFTYPGVDETMAWRCALPLAGTFNGSVRELSEVAASMAADPSTMQGPPAPRSPAQAAADAAGESLWDRGLRIMAALGRRGHTAVSRCDNYREDLDAPCTGKLWAGPGDVQARCDTCGAYCGILVLPDPWLLTE